MVPHCLNNWPVGFSQTGVGEDGQSKNLFLVLIAFESGTVVLSPDISFSDPIYIPLHSIFQEKDETKNLSCNYKTLQKL